MDLTQVIADALKADIARQVEAVPLHRGGPTDWTAHGGTINLTETARACLEAIERGGYVLLPKEPTEEMTGHPSYIDGRWSRRNYEAILEALAASPKAE